MDRKTLREFLDVCEEAKRFTEFFPELPKGLSHRHIKAIEAVHEMSAADEAVKVSDVSDYLGGTRPSVTKLIRELEAAGAITKERDTADRRVIWLGLTQLGESYYDFYCSRYQKWLGEALDEIPEEDFETMTRTLHNIYEILSTRHMPQR